MQDPIQMVITTTTIPTSLGFTKVLLVEIYSSLVKLYVVEGSKALFLFMKQSGLTIDSDIVVVLV